jgi:hypothetical protein
MDKGLGLLLVTMEPAAGAEDEFNDWYDMEHFPQRSGLPGFQTASRWVCLEGWPRYVALYDLSGTAALETAAYRAVSGSNSTPWSKRVLPRTLGRLRIVAEQAIPGHEPTAGPGGVSRLLIARYPAPAAQALAAPFRPLPGLQQVRVFASGPSTSWVLAAFNRPVGLPMLAEAGGAGAEMFNLYAPYWRG